MEQERNRNEIREKIKTDYKYLLMKVILMKRDLFKTDVFCLFVCFNSYKGRSKPPWLRMTDAVKRNDQIKMERTLKSFIKVWTFRNSVIFFCEQKKKRSKKRLIRKIKNCNFVGTMSLLKREIAKKMGHCKTQNFLNATMYGARLVIYVNAWTLKEIKMEFFYHTK